MADRNPTSSLRSAICFLRVAFVSSILRTVVFVSSALLVENRLYDFGKGLRVASSLFATNSECGEITEKVWIVRRNM